jgi:hypothetical protein
VIGTTVFGTGTIPANTAVPNERSATASVMRTNLLIKRKALLLGFVKAAVHNGAVLTPNKESGNESN